MVGEEYRAQTDTNGILRTDGRSVMKSFLRATHQWTRTRFFRIVAFAAMGVFLMSALQPAQAQQWRQRATVMTDVNPGQSTRAFIDTVAARLRNSDTLQVRRTKEGELMDIQTLTDSLLEEGVGLYSANRLFIDYEFEVVDNEFIEEIQDIKLIYRPASSGEGDIPILYLDAERELVANVLRNSGIPDERNLDTVHYFVNEISFPSLALDQNVRVISVAERKLREGFDQRRKVLMRQLKAFIYDKDKVYHTRILADQQ